MHFLVGTKADFPCRECSKVFTGDSIECPWCKPDNFEGFKSLLDELPYFYCSLSKEGFNA